MQRWWRTATRYYLYYCIFSPGWACPPRSLIEGSVFESPPPWRTSSGAEDFVRGQLLPEAILDKTFFTGVCILEVANKMPDVFIKQLLQTINSVFALRCRSWSCRGAWHCNFGTWTPSRAAFSCARLPCAPTCAHIIKARTHLGSTGDDLHEIKTLNQDVNPEL